MIFPRVLFLGDPAAATPWVGLAKKLAREAYRDRIVQKTWKISESVQIRVVNYFPLDFSDHGICKVWVAANQDHSFLVASIAITPYGHIDGTARLGLFKKIAKPYDIHSTDGPYNPIAPPSAYGPYSLANWVNSVNCVSMEGWDSAGSALIDEENGGPLCVNSKGYRLVFYRSYDSETLLYDQYRHYSIILSKNKAKLEFLYETPFWKDEYVVYGKGYSSFAIDDSFLYELISTNNTDQDKRGWLSIRNLNTGKIIIDHIQLPYIYSCGIAACNRKVFLCGFNYGPSLNVAILRMYKISSSLDTVNYELSWEDVLNADTKYVDAIAMNKSCAYVLFDSSIRIPGQKDILQATFESRSLKTGGLVGQLTFSWNSDIPGDEEDNVFGWFEGIAANEKNIVVVQNGNRAMRIFKRIPVYDGDGDIVSETYTHEYSIKVSHVPDEFYGWAPLSVIGH